MKLYGLKPLAEKAGISRTSLYNIYNGASFETETLDKISKILNIEFGILTKTPEKEQVAHHLAYYGAPLVFDKSLEINMNLEETIKWGIFYSMTDGLFESLLTYFLRKRFSSINKLNLYSFLDQKYQLQLLGYYLDLANQYSYNKKIEDFFNSFYQKNLQPLYLGSSKPTTRFLNIYNSKSNQTAKKWNIFTLDSPDDYFIKFRKWDKLV
ncbi:MAG: helix-turn-helix domain-containing protein [Pseudobdellovibrionaceae bacterium]